METKTNRTQLAEGTNETKKTPTDTLKKPKPEKKEKKPHSNLKPLLIFKGIVKEWIYNKDFIYDGFILNTYNESIKIKFPPHLGKSIMASVENNPEIYLKGIIHSSPEDVKTVHLINFKSEGNTIDSMPPAKLPTLDVFTCGEGKIIDFQYDSKDNICGYFVNDNYLLKIPPHIAEELKNLIQKEISVEFTGMIKANKEGEVKVKDYILIDIRTLVVNTNEYLIK